MKLIGKSFVNSPTSHISLLRKSPQQCISTGDILTISQNVLKFAKCSIKSQRQYESSNSSKSKLSDVIPVHFLLFLLFPGET